MLLVLSLAACSNLPEPQFASGGERHTTQSATIFGGGGGGDDTGSGGDDTAGDTATTDGPAPVVGLVTCEMTYDTSSAVSAIACASRVQDAQDDAVGGSVYVTLVANDGTSDELSAITLDDTEGSSSTTGAWLVDGLMSVLVIGSGSHPIDVNQDYTVYIQVRDQAGHSSDEVSGSAAAVGS